MSAFPVFLFQAAAPAAATGGGSSVVFFVQMAVIVAIFYFIVLRPQRKQQKQLEAALMAMSKGDEIVTAGGLIGEVVYIKETLSEGKPSGVRTEYTTSAGHVSQVGWANRGPSTTKP